MLLMGCPNVNLLPLEPTVFTYEMQNRVTKFYVDAGDRK